MHANGTLMLYHNYYNNQTRYDYVSMHAFHQEYITINNSIIYELFDASEYIKVIEVTKLIRSDINSSKMYGELNIHSCLC